MSNGDRAPAGLSPTALETKTFSVTALLEAMRQGRVRIPYFQRQFRWQDEDRRLLFDSLQKGFPVGTLLLAQGAAPAETVSLGGFTADVHAAKDALWVVDGQQRLSTLAMALLDDHSGAYRPIFFDLVAGEFVLGGRKRASPPHWVPTSVLASSASLNRWLREASMPDELSDRADRIASRIREYQLPAYLVPYDGEDDGLLKTIFERVNRSKRALSSDEVFQALHSSRTEGRPIDRVRDELSRVGFGELDEKQIERAAMAVSGKLPRRTLVEVVDATEVPVLFKRLGASLLRAVEFLAEDAGVPHVQWLPYGGALATLARLFDVHPRLHDRNRELLARWYWRGNLSGYHRTDNRTDGPKWQAIVKNEHESIQGLLALGAGADIPASLDAELLPFNRATARTRIDLVALAALEPRLLTGEDRGQLVPLAALIEESQDFPAPLVRSGEKTIASYLLHPEIDLDELRRSPPGRDLLASQGMDEPILAALLRGDEPAFLDGRRKLLTEHVRSTLRRWTGMDAADRDRRPLDDYFETEAT